MAKKPTHGGEAWTSQQNVRLDKLATGNTPTRLIAYKLGRSEEAVRHQASKLNISLKPTNQAPYNRRERN